MIKTLVLGLSLACLSFVQDPQITTAQLKCPDCVPSPSGDFSNSTGNVCADGSVIISPLRTMNEVKGGCKPSATVCVAEMPACSLDRRVKVSFAPGGSTCGVVFGIDGGDLPEPTRINNSETVTLSASAECGSSGTDTLTVTGGNAGSPGAGSPVTYTFTVTCPTCISG